MQMSADADAGDRVETVAPLTFASLTLSAPRGHSIVTVYVIVERPVPLLLFPQMRPA